MVIKIQKSETPGVANKLAEAEVHFTDGPLAGMRLIGFAVWEARNGNGQRNVTLPSRAYTVNGERRNFALLRPVGDSANGDGIRAAILEAYAAYEQEVR